MVTIADKIYTQHTQYTKQQLEQATNQNNYTNHYIDYKLVLIFVFMTCLSDSFSVFNVCICLATSVASSSSNSLSQPIPMSDSTAEIAIQSVAPQVASSDAKSS